MASAPKLARTTRPSPSVIKNDEGVPAPGAPSSHISHTHCDGHGDHKPVRCPDGPLGGTACGFCAPRCAAATQLRKIALPAYSKHCAGNEACSASDHEAKQ